MTKASVTTKGFIPWRSIVQIIEGLMGVPAITALWYASSILKDRLAKENNYPWLMKRFTLSEERVEVKPATPAAETIGKAGAQVKEGIIGGLKGINVTRDVVQGAIEAAGSIGSTAVKAMRDVLVGAVGAVKDIASAALPKPESKTGVVPPKKSPTEA